MIQNGMVIPNRDGLAQERRTERRQRVLKGARLIYNGGQSVADAVVRNLSESGARVKLGETIGIPSECMLVLTGSNELRKAHVVWRSDTEMGLSLG